MKTPVKPVSYKPSARHLNGDVSVVFTTVEYDGNSVRVRTAADIVEMAERREERESYNTRRVLLNNGECIDSDGNSVHSTDPDAEGPEEEMYEDSPGVRAASVEDIYMGRGKFKFVKATRVFEEDGEIQYRTDNPNDSGNGRIRYAYGHIRITI